MMEFLSTRIRRLFPGAQIGPDGPITLENGHIARWDDSLGPQPTEEELLAAEWRSAKTPEQLWSDWQAMTNADAGPPVPKAVSDTIWKDAILHYITDFTATQRAELEASADADFGGIAQNRQMAKDLVAEVVKKPSYMQSLLDQYQIPYSVYEDQ